MSRPTKWVEWLTNSILFISHSRKPPSWSRKLVGRSVAKISPYFFFIQFIFICSFLLSLLYLLSALLLLLSGCYGQMYNGISFPYCHWCHSNHHRQGTPLNSFLTHIYIYIYIYIYILYTTPTNSSFFSFWIDCEPKQQRHPWHTRPSTTSHEQTSTLEPLLKTFGHTLLAAVDETASLTWGN